MTQCQHFAGERGMTLSVNSVDVLLSALEPLIAAHANFFGYPAYE
jgi:hypothetical protein